MFNNRPLKASDGRGGREEGGRRPTSNGAYGSFWGHQGTQNSRATGGHTQALPQFSGTTGGHTQALPQFRDRDLGTKEASQPPRSAWGSKDSSASRLRVDNNLTRKVDPLSKSLPHGRSHAVEDVSSRGPALPLHHRASPSRAFEQLSSSRGVLPNKDSNDLPPSQRMHGRPRGIRTELPSPHTNSREPTPNTKSPARREAPQKAGGFQSGSVPVGRAQQARLRHSQHSQMRKNADSRGPEGGGGRRAKPEAGIFGAKSMAGAYPQQGMGRAQAKENQDNFFMHELGDDTKDFYVGVVDGHGLQGKQVSGYVGNHLGKKIAAARNSTELAQIEQDFQSAFKSTAEELKRSGIEANESGTTAVTALRRGDNLYVANVGDSRCVLAREAGGKLQSVEMSDDHKPDRKDEKERILRNRGAVEPIRGFNGRFVGPCRVWTQKQVAGGLAVSRAIGDFSMEKAGVCPDPEIKQTKLSNADKFLVLASDGVWEHMSNQQVVDLAKKHKDPKAASDAIVAEARRQWTTKGCGYIDDITAVVMNLKE